MAKPVYGDLVRITAADAVHEGILLKNEETDSTVIKLDSGYNIGILPKNIKKIELIKKGKQAPEARAKPKRHAKAKKKKISILHTGGTIASKVDYKTGAVYSGFSPGELLDMFPELSDIADLDSKLISNMWSDDLRFSHLKKIAKAIGEEVKKGADGIIIGMGTDNLAVASAALAFIIESSPVPIILVGAQRSSDRGSSDAAMNLICAAEFITKTDFCHVAICMHKGSDDTVCSILPATKTAKLHTSRRDAFKPVNDTAIAEVDYRTRQVRFCKKDYMKKGKLKILPDMEEKVGLLKVHINMFPEEFLAFKGYKGLVIEGTGLGHTPGQVTDEETKIHKKIYDAIKTLTGSGCIVVMTSQCLFGRVHMHVYSKGTELSALGVISGEDMLANTALVKLSWLLANHPKEAKDLIGKDMRGEINRRLQLQNDVSNL